MDRTKTLVVGATGMLGGRIAHALLDGRRAEVRLLIRRGSLEQSGKARSLMDLLGKGAELVEGDLHDPASLDAAVEGVEVVVSAVQGGRDVIVDGQRALLDAAVKKGVRRILPSDFAVDLFEIPYGRHPFLNLRREVDEAVADSGLEHVHVLNGAFMDTMLSPFARMIDLEEGTGLYWGDGDQLVDFTSVEDTARFTAEAALDTNLPSGKFAVAGDTLTFPAAIAAVAAGAGFALEPRRLGGLHELEGWIGESERLGRPHLDYLMEQYAWAMASGVGKLTDIQNSRYPHIRPQSLEAFARDWVRKDAGVKAAA